MSAGASPQTPLGELTALPGPDPLAGLRGPTSKGRRGEGREGGGEAGEGKGGGGEGKGREGKGTPRENLTNPALEGREGKKGEGSVLPQCSSVPP